MGNHQPLLLLQPVIHVVRPGVTVSLRPHWFILVKGDVEFYLAQVETYEVPIHNDGRGTKYYCRKLHAVN